MPDLYGVLGVPKDADKDAIKKAYRRKAKECHPDRMGGDNTAMVLVNRAYETLSDAKRRERYDLGEDDDGRSGVNSEEMRAAQMIWSILGQVIDSVEESDWIAATAQQLEQNIRKVEGKLPGLAKMETRYKRQMARVRRKKKDDKPNIIIMVWEQRLASIAEERANIDEQLKLARMALDLLAEYESPLPEGFRPTPPRSAFMPAADVGGLVEQMHDMLSRAKGFRP